MIPERVARELNDGEIVVFRSTGQPEMYSGRVKRMPQLEALMRYVYVTPTDARISPETRGISLDDGFIYRVPEIAMDGGMSEKDLRALAEWQVDEADAKNEERKILVEFFMACFPKAREHYRPQR